MADSFSVSSVSPLIEQKYFNTSFVWKIARAKRRSLTAGQVVISPLFQCSDASWQLEAYFRGISKNSTSMMFRLICVPETDDFSYIAHIKLSIWCDQGNQLGEITHGKYIFDSHNLKEDLYCCFSSFSFDGIDTGAVTINFSISLDENDFPVFPSEEATKEEVKVKSLSPISILNSLSSDFEELYSTRPFTDVTLNLDENKFEVHKSVLSARSTVFAAMFEHDMKENRQNVVDLVQMEVETARDMLRYIYCGKVRDLSADEALSLYVAADRYNLKELKTLCREVVLPDICIRNVFHVAEVAGLHEDEVLIKALKYFLTKSGKDIITSEAWKTMCINKSALGAKMFEWAFSK